MTNSIKSGSLYLFWCAHEHPTFRIPEFESLTKIFDIELDIVEQGVDVPWVILNLKSEHDAKKILSRSVSAKYCIQLWGDATSYEDLEKQIRESSEELVLPYSGAETSFKVCVDAFMKKLTMTEKIERIEKFSFLPMQGPVNLKTPDVILSLFEYYGSDHNHLKNQPLRLFFGRCVGEGQRELITKLSLKSRCFIANTSMDPTLSLLMANLACVSDKSVLIDPFVGSGSLIVAAAQFGGRVIGSDIDYLMMHGRTKPSRVGQKKRSKGENVRGNFEQYKLGSNYLDIVVADMAALPWRAENFFDAIITDPPYGLREPTEKIGTTRANPEVPKEFAEQHFPQKVDYHLGDILSDLLSFGACSLALGGRLVFWIPVNREHYREEKLPRHPCLRLIANCEQYLSSHTSRRCLVFEKISNTTNIDFDPTTVRLNIHETIEKYKDNFYRPTRGMRKKERKERLKTFGHLNLTSQEDNLID